MCIGSQGLGSSYTSFRPKTRKLNRMWNSLGMTWKPHVMCCAWKQRIGELRYCAGPEKTLQESTWKYVSWQSYTCISKCFCAEINLLLMYSFIKFLVYPHITFYIKPHRHGSSGGESLLKYFDSNPVLAYFSVEDKIKAGQTMTNRLNHRSSTMVRTAVEQFLGFRQMIMSCMGSFI